MEDCLHIIYVNGAHKDNSPLGLLIQDFHCSDPRQMYYKKLADRARYFKEEEEGIRKMSGFADEIREEGREEAQEDVAIEMLRDGGISKEKIAQYTKLPLDVIEELAAELSEESNLMPV